MKKSKVKFHEDELNFNEGGDGDISVGSLDESDEEDQDVDPIDSGKPHDEEKRRKNRENKQAAMKAHKRIMGTDAGARGPDEAIKRIEAARDMRATELHLGWLDL